MSSAERMDAFLCWRSISHELAAEVHVERWRVFGIESDAVNRLVACLRSRQMLSTQLEWILPGGVAAWDDGIEITPVTKPALLPGAALWQAGLRFGAAANQAAIRMLVWRGDVEAFKAAAGSDAYAFALRKAGLICRDGDLTDDDPNRDEPLARRVSRSAGLALGCWLASLPVHLAARMRLKLPPECDPELASAAAWEPQRRKEWLTTLIKIFSLCE